MKIFKSIFTLVTVISLTFVSCSKSDDDSQTNTLLVGKFIEEKAETLDVNGNVIKTYPASFHPCGVDYLEFFADGTLLDVYYGRYNDECYEEFFKSTYKIANDNITLVYEGGTSETLKFKVTDNTFVLAIPVTKEQAEEEGYDPSVVEKRIIYKKQ